MAPPMGISFAASTENPASGASNAVPAATLPPPPLPAPPAPAVLVSEEEFSYASYKLFHLPPSGLPRSLHDSLKAVMEDRVSNFIQLIINL